MARIQIIESGEAAWWLRLVYRLASNEPQIVELTSAIAWENYRVRFNRALGVQAVGYSEGAVCVLPQKQL